MGRQKTRCLVNSKPIAVALKLGVDNRMVLIRAAKNTNCRKRDAIHTSMAHYVKDCAMSPIPPDIDRRRLLVL
jgi:hypothetical protein